MFVVRLFVVRPSGGSWYDDYNDTNDRDTNFRLKAGLRTLLVNYLSGASYKYATSCSLFSLPS